MSLLHAVPELITAHGLDLETFDCLPPDPFRRERLLVLVLFLPLQHFHFRPMHTPSNSEWAGVGWVQLSASSSQSNYITKSLCAILKIKHPSPVPEIIRADMHKILIRYLLQRLFHISTLGPAYLRFVEIGTIVSAVSLVE